MTRLILDQTPPEGTRDTALSHAILREVAEGRSPATLRIHRPTHIMAFGRQDVSSPTYTQAVEAAERGGYTPVERLAGGRAAVFHPGTIALSWAVPAADPKRSITARFELISDAIAAALNSLGLDARVGEIEGEYCPGRYSVNVGGERKLMGVGQRLIVGAAHVGCVIVVHDRDGTRSILEAVYDALGLAWIPDTVGAVSDHANVSWSDVVDAVIGELRDELALEVGELSAAEKDRAVTLTAGHVPSIRRRAT